MSESCGHNQGVASASSVAGTPRSRGCDKIKVPACRAPKVRVPDHIPRESHTCMGSADTELINHNAWLHGFDRSQVAHIEVLVFGRGEEDMDSLVHWGY
ncbi:hypothetical protein N9L68_07130 [bacterium]|nr:hypothetical protein [bacterium]